MIKRLCPKHSDADLAKIYARPHGHLGFGHGHYLRVQFAIELGKWAKDFYQVSSVGDLSCGDAAIAHGINAKQTYLGDFAPGYQFRGPLNKTLPQIPAVDLFINSETIEHLDDPQEALSQIREKSRVLLLSTPVENWEDSNEEHYWSWDVEGVEEMMTNSGWSPVMHATLDSRYIGEPYKYGFWVAL